MAQLFVANPAGKAAMYALGGATVLLSEPDPRQLESDPTAPAGDAVLLRTSPDPRCREWFLEFSHGRRGVWVNGVQRTAGFYVLGDEDRVRITGGCSFVFTNEEIPACEVFAGSEDRVECQRCHVELVMGDRVVRCGCGSVYHYDENSRDDCCWRSADRCRVCGRSTAMDGVLTRIPEVN